MDSDLNTSLSEITAPPLSPPLSSSLSPPLSSSLSPPLCLSEINTTAETGPDTAVSLTVLSSPGSDDERSDAEQSEEETQLLTPEEFPSFTTALTSLLTRAQQILSPPPAPPRLKASETPQAQPKSLELTQVKQFLFALSKRNNDERSEKDKRSEEGDEPSEEETSTQSTFSHMFSRFAVDHFAELTPAIYDAETGQVNDQFFQSRSVFPEPRFTDSSASQEGAVVHFSLEQNYPSREVLALPIGMIYRKAVMQHLSETATPEQKAGPSLVLLDFYFVLYRALGADNSDVSRANLVSNIEYLMAAVEEELPGFFDVAEETPLMNPLSAIAPMMTAIAPSVMSSLPGLLSSDGALNSLDALTEKAESTVEQGIAHLSATNPEMAREARNSWTALQQIKNIAAESLPSAISETGGVDPEKMMGTASALLSNPEVQQNFMQIFGTFGKMFAQTSAGDRGRGGGRGGGRGRGGYRR